jgi:cytidylate kinase
MKPDLHLPYRVEERLAGWARILEGRRAELPAKAKPRPTVTISRQFGCEGFPLVLQLHTLLNKATGEPWMVFDKYFIEHVARDEQISMQILEHLHDPARYLEGFGFHPRGAVTTSEAIAKMATTILHVAGAGNAIILGRGGALLCHKLENCFHFRLEADRDWRVASLARRMGISRAEAGELEKSRSRDRDHFIRENLQADTADRSLYDAVFNNERHGVDEIAAAILAYVKRGWKGEGFLPDHPTR